MSSANSIFFRSAALTSLPPKILFTVPLEDIVRKLSGVGADIRVVITPDEDKAQADVG